MWNKVKFYRFCIHSVDNKLYCIYNGIETVGECMAVDRYVRNHFKQRLWYHYYIINVYMFTLLLTSLQIVSFAYISLSTIIRYNPTRS